MSVLAVERSANSKVGVAHATYVSQASCPTTCPLRGGGCYAESGPTGLWTRKVNNADPSITGLGVAKAEAEAIRTVLSGRHDLRLHVVGDCSTDEAARIVSEAALSVLKTGRQAWSYTHAAADVQRESWGEVSVLASSETPEQVKAAQDAGWATAVIVPEFQSDGLYKKDGLKILPCVNQTRGATCVECRLCMDDTRLAKKGITIGFTPHGARAKTVRKALPTVQ